MMYIALLRAINVGGHTVTMETLRGYFAAMGFTSVRSFIQTGNIFFESNETNRKALVTRIETHLRSALGYEVAAMVRTIPELEHAIASHPFRGIELTEDMRLYIVFISQPLPGQVVFPLCSPKGDFELRAATEGEVFLVLRVVAGRSGNPSAFIEKTFGVKATARFFTTTEKILAAAKSG